MSSIDRITLVLRPHAGTTIEELKRYAAIGIPVGVGRTFGVIAGASEGDVMERAEQLESQVVLAEAAMRRGIQIPEDYAVVSQPHHIDERVRMAADARRYQWLRDRERVEDADTDLVVARDRDCFYGNALDREVDDAMRLERLLEKHGEPV